MKDASKDVLVMFHSDYVNPDKILTSKEPLALLWNEIAKDVENIEDLIIAKFNVLANEVIGLNVNRFPYLKFYPKDDKKGM